MKLEEVVKEENLNKKYKITLNIDLGIWTLKKTTVLGSFDFYNEKGKILSNEFFLSNLIKMNFEEVIDWGKLPVDTKILVSDDNKNWVRRHFAGYFEGYIYTWESGLTSFTTDSMNKWENAMLYEE